MNPIKAQYDERGSKPHKLIKALPYDRPQPGTGEALVELLAAPINPSDLLTITGDYGVLPDLPAIGGNEGIGKITELGPKVSGLEVGQTVLLPVGCGTWRSHLALPAKDLIPLPGEADPLQLAMLTINPPTAALLLSEVVDLEPGDWVIQNAANSAVGGYLVQLAAERGLQTVNVVRREGAVESVRKQGGEVVLVDGPDLARRVAEATGKAKIRLAIDAVGGEATERLAACLTDDGTVANYGMMSGEPCQISAGQLIFRHITLTGFWLASWFEQSSPADRQQLFGDLIGKIAAGKLSAPVAATYPLSRVSDALRAASRGERDGKILLTPE
ncbi:zinc-dependent alcohol dehydrogenase family protein [Wenzhouxiangella sp. AB-CW3]|uniref:zinc-dependent alcohol dehydrogenase family protein n=1 Tax=Wenzhouxiangella sp. AB-CW3 TaxID=2771012 RepID=UPI00168B508A|nr:zinc-dependent alcohol dehydrogenase family protein [Wenzhouxiangella sp. AB-CW3]QOC22739.1 zinc-dependent alcohol dehydrogenase family protein [Wenzhouxiangella sp. AB-CW3]